MRLIFRLTALLALISIAGCAGWSADETANWSAQQFYEKGREALDDNNYSDAVMVPGGTRLRACIRGRRQHCPYSSIWC